LLRDSGAGFVWLVAREGVAPLGFAQMSMLLEAIGRL
jgi:hypothetical protein